MKCPHCDGPISGIGASEGSPRRRQQTVIDSRPVDSINSIRRRRECPACGTRVTTMESVIRIDIPGGVEDEDEMYVVGTA